MNDNSRFEDTTEPGDDYQKLAHWLQQVLAQPSQEKASTSAPAQNDLPLEVARNSNYHLTFYQQLPDFIMALLTNDAQAAVHYAPLLYHLAGCSECHADYLELYDAMRVSVDPHEPHPILGQGTRSLAATPHRMLGHLCQLLISQAEAVLLQGRREHSNADAAARVQLQLALQISAHIGQSNVRRQALQDLVRVATIVDGPAEEGPDVRTYTPALVGAGGMRRTGKKTLRRLETPTRSTDPPQEPPIINLQSHTLEGSITQNGYTLELHLQELDEALRGHYITVSVLLGSLIEPVRWRGGNPRAIPSAEPVDATGALTIPLGETALRLEDPEEHNLLEAMFMLLEVRVAD